MFANSSTGQIYGVFSFTGTPFILQNIKALGTENKSVQVLDWGSNHTDTMYGYLLSCTHVFLYSLYASFFSQ